MNGKTLEKIEKLLDADEIESDAAIKLLLAFHIDLAAEFKALKKNPMVWLGTTMTEHPKVATAAAIILVVLLNLWFIDGVRELVLTNLGFDKSIVDLLGG